MKCDVDKIITGTIEKKYYTIQYLKTELGKMLGREIQIYLVISDKEREEFFRTTGFSNTLDNGNKSLFNYNFLPFGKGYVSGELTVPYKNFHNLFESFFHINRAEELEKEKKKELEFLKSPSTKKTGGFFDFGFKEEVKEEVKEEDEKEEVKEEEEKEEEFEPNSDIEIEKFLFYNLHRDLKIRISV